jgi:topoisomerase IV subunit A
MTTKNDNIINIDFGKALSERYLSYALSTILSRSLPDVRDGLKTVHRRLLYAMLNLNLNPTSSYKKCARVVGDVIGKFHPHGEVAVYDTLVRLTQDFSLRYPMIDGQGNFGSIDGDNAAAMRYTESRMTNVGALLMQDIDKDTVDFRATYDNSDEEPVLFPAAFPNLLANGSEGIAVGMATSIPSHNLHELCDALIYLIDNKDACVQDMLQFIEGPDLPTGGIIIDSKNVIAENYAQGKGSFKVRARWHKEEIGHGIYQIVITEIPYQIQKSKLIEQIADLLKNKKIPLVSNIKDESADDVRIIIEPKSRNCSAEMVMESLFKLSNLQSRLQFNMNVIGSNNIPRIMNLTQVLQEFLSHRSVVVTRRSKFLSDKILRRIETLEGLKIAYLNLDEVIHIIRTEDDPKLIMMQRFALSDLQVEAILNTRLRSLRKLDEQEIIDELDKLSKEHQELSEILDNPKILWKTIKKEIKSIQNIFSKDTVLGARKTSFAEIEQGNIIVDISAFIEREPITILCSKMGWIRSIKWHNNDLLSIKYKEGDEAQFILECYTTDKIIICSAGGRFFTILADNIFKGKGNGESLKLMIDIGNDEMVDIFVHSLSQKMLLAASGGRGFIVNSNELLASTKVGKQIMNISKGEACIKCLKADKELVATVGENRKLLIFPLSEIPEMKRGSGVTLQRFKDARLTDIKLLNKEEGLTFTTNAGKIKTESLITSWLGKRAGGGKIPPVGFSKDNVFGI